MSRQPQNIAQRTVSPVPQLEGDPCSKATRGTTIGQKEEEEEEEEPRVLSPVLQLKDTLPSPLFSCSQTETSSWVRQELPLRTPNDHSVVPSADEREATLAAINNRDDDERPSAFSHNDGHEALNIAQRTTRKAQFINQGADNNENDDDENNENDDNKESQVLPPTSTTRHEESHSRTRPKRITRCPTQFGLDKAIGGNDFFDSNDDELSYESDSELFVSSRNLPDDDEEDEVLVYDDVSSDDDDDLERSSCETNEGGCDNDDDDDNDNENGEVNHAALMMSMTSDPIDKMGKISSKTA